MAKQARPMSLVGIMAILRDHGWDFEMDRWGLAGFDPERPLVLVEMNRPGDGEPKLLTLTSYYELFNAYDQANADISARDFLPLCIIDRETGRVSKAVPGLTWEPLPAVPGFTLEPLP